MIESGIYLTKSAKKMIIGRDIIEKIGFDHSRSRSRQINLPQLLRISLFRRITDMVSSGHPRRRGSFNCHEEFIFWVELEGRGALLVSDCTFTLNAGEAMLVFPGQPHFRLPLEKSRAEWLLIRFTAVNVGSLEFLRNRIVKPGGAELDQLRQIITLWNDTDSPTGTNRLSSALLALLFSIRENIIDTQDNDADFQNINSISSVYVKELCELLMHDSPDSDPFETTARKWSVTKEHLHRVFRKHMGRPAREFINYRKLVLARHLLRHSGLTVSEIALQVGFQSVYAFSRFFKKECGSSPAQYRKACLE